MQIHERKGGTVVGGVIALIAVAIAILIGYIVLVQVQNTLPTSTLTTSQVDNLNSIGDSLTNAFLLTTVLPVVLVASLILAGFFAFMGGEGWLKSRRGGTVVGGVIALIAVAIAILIGYIVLVQVQNTLPTSTLTTTQVDNLNSIGDSLTNAFLLTTVLPVVLVASLILAGFFAFMGGEGLLRRANKAEITPLVS